ncbi:hypothetical protein QJS04_geneDACA015473 [Acorus gramineus]|uniref:Uncharacterized protein n=1 Tax=Acorus gramineus TaxID=55184 RepID=A0AAV9A514_ACOGR|nr:hypothetical protein QJS04_geneDACA015473 [Acorus gramineus]
MSVLMKLAGGCPSLADQLNVDAFLEQARSYEKASSSPVGWYIRNAQTRQLSHPLPVLRAREIDKWSRSEDPARSGLSPWAVCGPGFYPAGRPGSSPLARKDHGLLGFGIHGPA